MPSRKHKEYDDDSIVHDLAASDLTHEQIADKHGLSTPFVGQISRGEKRPELQERIDAVIEGMKTALKRRGVRLADKAMNALETLTEKPAANHKGCEVQRKAAETLLKHAIGDPSKTDVHVGDSVKYYKNVEAEKV